MKAWPLFNKILIFLLIIIAVIAMLLFFDLSNNTNPSQNQGQPTGQTETQYISETTPIRQEIYYNLCRHLVTSDQTGNSDFVGKTFAELNNDGWEVFWGENGQAVLFKEVFELCPEDEHKCHISAYEGRVTIFPGPLDSETNPLEITDIYLDDLYPEIRDKITAGMEFESMEELLIAMESLDEFQ